MSTTLAPPSRPEVVPEATDGARVRRSRRRAGGEGTLARPLRFAAFAALVVYGCLHWVRQVAPTQTGVALQISGVAIALALVTVSGVTGSRRRRLAVALLCATGAVVGLAAAGIPLRFVGWRHWGELATGAAEGLVTLPNINVPYRGLDEWVRWIVLSGAALLGVLAAALAFAPGGAERPRRRLSAALALSLLYGVPVVERNPESPFFSGAGFAVLLALFLGADRLAAVVGARPRLIALGAGLTALALGALVAPRLDGDGPWVDYRGLAGDLGERNQTSFDWNHSYSPLGWPRDGRELLRVKVKEPAYWKATVLRRFDGVRWVYEEPFDSDLVDTPRPAGELDWYQRIDVTVRGLRSEEYFTAGFASKVSGVSPSERNSPSTDWPVIVTDSTRPSSTAVRNSL